MRISDWSSDVCSSDLALVVLDQRGQLARCAVGEAERSETELGRLAERGGRPGGHPHGRVGRTVGLREHVALRHPEVLALVGVGLALPHLRDLGDGLAPHGLGSVDVVDVERSAERRFGNGWFSTCKFWWSTE